MEKKPDFDQIFTEMYGHPDIPSDRIIGIQDCWNIYVTPLQSQLSEAEKRIDKLQAFKDYVHDRLDKMGIPVDPDSPHKEAGCRIGGRFDIVQSQNERLLSALKDEMSPRVAKLLLKIRDEIAKEDIAEAYNSLYEIASPKFDKYEPWENIERIALLINDSGER